MDDFVMYAPGRVNVLGKKGAVAAALIFAAAFAFRWWYMDELVLPQPIRGDAIHYVQYAKNMLEHGVFSRESSTNPLPDSYFTPGYPFFLAACMYVSKALGMNAYVLILTAQALLGALVAVLTFLLARLFLGLTASVFAATLTIFSPHLISHGGYLLTETLFSFVLALALYLFIRAIIGHRSWWLIPSGALFGCAYLINPITMLAPLLLALLALYFSREQQIDKRMIAASVLVYLGIFGAWHLRNTLEVPEGGAGSSDRVFWNFIIGMHSDYHRIWRNNPRDPNNPADVDKRNFDGSYRLLREALWARVKERPGHYVAWYFFRKPVQLWSWDILTGQGDIYVYPVQSTLYFSSWIASLTESLMKSLHYWLFGAALLGWLFLRRDNNEASRVALACLYAVLVYVSAVYVVLQSEPRYSVPLRPEMYICAVYFLVHLLKYLGSLRERAQQDFR